MRRQGGVFHFGLRYLFRWSLDALSDIWTYHGKLQTGICCAGLHWVLLVLRHVLFPGSHRHTSHDDVPATWAAQVKLEGLGQGNSDSLYFILHVGIVRMVPDACTIEGTEMLEAHEASVGQSKRLSWEALLARLN